MEAYGIIHMLDSHCFPQPLNIYGEWDHILRKCVVSGTPHVLTALDGIGLIIEATPPASATASHFLMCP